LILFLHHLVDFSPQHSYFSRGGNAEPNLVAAHPDDRHDDIVADRETLAGPATQYQHEFLLLEKVKKIGLKHPCDRKIDQLLCRQHSWINLIFWWRQNLHANDALGDLLCINLILSLENAFFYLFDSFRSEFALFASKAGYSVSLPSLFGNIDLG
jgi:hypothetical protein